MYFHANDFHANNFRANEHLANENLGQWSLPEIEAVELQYTIEECIGRLFKTLETYVYGRLLYWNRWTSEEVPSKL